MVHIALASWNTHMCTLGMIHGYTTNTAMLESAQLHTGMHWLPRLLARFPVLGILLSSFRPLFPLLAPKITPSTVMCDRDIWTHAYQVLGIWYITIYTGQTAELDGFKTVTYIYHRVGRLYK